MTAVTNLPTQHYDLKDPNTKEDEWSVPMPDTLDAESSSYDCVPRGKHEAGDYDAANGSTDTGPE
ncbi:MAG: hypothetical protein Q9169_005934 [Polycauliona sp. 2 TL-2023]